MKALRLFGSLAGILFLTSAQIEGCRDRYGGGSALPAFAPVITASIPANGATGVPTTASVTVVFSTAMDPTTITPANIVLQETLSGTGVTSVISYLAATTSVRITPVVPLPGTTSYTLTLTTGIKGTQSIPLDSAFLTTFTTGSLPDTTPPVFGGATAAAPVNSVSIGVFWTTAADDFDPPSSLTYSLYVSTVPGGQDFAAPSVMTQPGATSGLVSGLLSGTQYFIVARATDSSANEESNIVEVSAVPQTPKSWLNDVWNPILAVHCQTCHTSGSGAFTFTMTNSTVAYQNMVNVPAVACAPLLRVNPFVSAGSVLYLKVNGITCGLQMPLGLPPLSVADQNTLRDWIDEGALNN